MFIGLDSNSVGDSTQLNFLKAKLAEAHANNDVTHIFLWWHHSAYSPGTTHGDDTTVQSTWVPLVEAEPKVSAVFSGHDHIYARMQHGSSKIAYVVSGGAGADNKTYGVSSTVSKATMVVGLQKYNFTALHIAGGVVSGIAYDDTGAQIDTFTVTQQVPGGGGGGNTGGSGGGGGGGNGGSGNGGGSGGGVGSGGGSGGGDGQMMNAASTGCDYGAGRVPASAVLVMMVVGGLTLRRRRA
jgi:MYXO-CTERM domain-containing protein